MATPKHKSKIILAIGAILLMGFAGVYALTFYLLKKEVGQTSAILQQQAQGESRRDNIEAFKKTITETADKRAMLEAFFLTPDNVPDFISNIEEWGTKLGLKATLSGLREDDTQTLSFSVQADGTFDQITRFMELLQNMPYDVHLDKVSLINQVEGEKTSGKVWHSTFDIRITSYVGDTKK
jgi:Tfp pilus assembly protein PilO